MKHYLAFVLLLAVIIAPPTQAAAIAYSEDFEDETPPSAPLTDFGTWTIGSDLTAVVEAGVFGDPTSGSQFLNLSNTGLDRDAILQLDTSGQYGEVSAWIDGGTDVFASTSILLQSPTGNVLQVDSGASNVIGRIGVNGVDVADCTTNVKVTAFLYWDAQLIDLTILEDDLTPCYSNPTLPFRNSASLLDELLFSVSSSSSSGYVDSIFLSLEQLEAPTGVYSENVDGSVEPNVYVLQWWLSPNDPNQDLGEWSYLVYREIDGGGFEHLLTMPPGEASGGIIGITISNLTATNTISYYVVASSGAGVSPASCVVLVEEDITGFTDACGVPLPGNESPGSDLTGPNGGLFGGDKDALAEALQVSAASLEFLMAIMLILLITAGGFFAYGALGAGGGLMVGITTSYALDLLPFWSIYFFLFIGAAGSILYVKSRGAMNG